MQQRETIGALNQELLVARRDRESALRLLRLMMGVADDVLGR